MSLDHHDAAAVERFTAEVDTALGAASAGPQGWTVKLIGVWLVAAAVLTAAIRSDGVLATILYVAGLAVVVAWVAGFYLARGERERWFANG